MSTFGAIIKEPFTITGEQILSSGGADVEIHGLAEDETPLGIFLKLESKLTPDSPCDIHLSVYASHGGGNTDVFGGMAALNIGAATIPWGKVGSPLSGDDASVLSNPKLVWSASITNGSPSAIDGEISGYYAYAKYTP